MKQFWDGCLTDVTMPLCRSAGYSNEASYAADDSPGVNVDQSPTRKPSVACSDVPTQTPSPSDSGVGELEAMLKEREAEILTLRQVMDRNERAIFQVSSLLVGQLFAVRV